MLIAIIIIIIRYHLVRRTFEAHTLIASTTSDSKATISPYDRHLTTFIGADSHTIFLHIFFEQGIRIHFSLLASLAIMYMLL
jgi:hypothetical protein